MANGRIIPTLKGGYDINSIAHAITMCTKALFGAPLSMLKANQSPCPSAVNSIINTLKTHKRFWANSIFKKSLPQGNVLPKATVLRSKPTELSDSLEDFLNQKNKLEAEQNSIKVVHSEIH